MSVSMSSNKQGLSSIESVNQEELDTEKIDKLEDLLVSSPFLRPQNYRRRKYNE